MKPKNTICLWYDKDALEAARKPIPAYLTGVRSMYAPAPDGKRFLINAPGGETGPRSAPIVVLDWPALRTSGK